MAGAQLGYVHWPSPWRPSLNRFGAGLLACVFVACLFTVTSVTLAQDTADQDKEPAAKDARAILLLVIEGQPQGEVEVRLRGGDIVLPIDALNEIGIALVGEREMLDGIEHVSLASLVDDLLYSFNEDELLLNVAPREQIKQNSVIDLRQLYRPNNIEYGKETSAFLNYAGRATNFKHFDAAFETGVSVQGHLLFSNFTVDRDGKFIRGLTNLTFDFPDSLLRVTVGDAFTAGDALGGSLFIGGLKVARQFTLDPYFVRFPSFGLSGAVQGASTLDVYVDGRLVRSQQVQPGTFELQNLPVIRGAGATQVVVRDAFGRQETISSPYYFSTGMLKPGLQEYSYALGYRRNRIGKDSWDYDHPSAQGTHRFGIKNWLTAGFRAEAADDMINGGASGTFRLPYGELEVTGAASHDSGLNGGAVSVGYTYLSKPFSAGGMFRYQSNEYSHLSLPVSVNRAELEGTLFGAVPIGTRVNLTLQYTAARYRNNQERDRIGLLGLFRLTKRTNLLATAAYNRVDRAKRFEGFVQLTHFFGHKTTASVSHRQTGKQRLESLQVQRPLGLGQDYGYRAEVQEGDVDRAFLLGQYQSEFGRYELSYERVGENDTVIASIAGGGCDHRRRRTCHASGIEQLYTHSSAGCQRRPRLPKQSDRWQNRPTRRFTRPQHTGLLRKPHQHRRQRRAP